MLALYDERKVNQRTAIVLRTERSLKTTSLKLILAGFYRSNTINRKQRPSSLAFQKIGNDADEKRSAFSIFFSYSCQWSICVKNVWCRKRCAVSKFVFHQSYLNARKGDKKKSKKKRKKLVCKITGLWISLKKFFNVKVILSILPIY